MTQLKDKNPNLIKWGDKKKKKFNYTFNFN